MRLIGHLKDESSARLFSNFLYVKGIENQADPTDDGAWELWIHDEGQLDEARDFLTHFQDNPGGGEYKAVATAAKAKMEQEKKDLASFQKKVYDRDRMFAKGIRSIPPLTGILVALSVIASVLAWMPPENSRAKYLFITEYRIEGEYVRWDGALPEVRKGQVWRLITPIFLHANPFPASVDGARTFSLMGLLHLVFNMMWLLDLGGMIEKRKGWWTLLLLVILFAIPSNLAQFLRSGPMFRGMSGVVFGLLGYIWMHVRFGHGSGLVMHQKTFRFMMFWFVMCFLIPGIANAAHAGGLAVGLALGYIMAKLTARK